MLVAERAKVPLPVLLMPRMVPPSLMTPEKVVRAVLVAWKMRLVKVPVKSFPLRVIGPENVRAFVPPMIRV